MPEHRFAIPELLTDRLRLRAHRLSDLDALATLWADEGSVRYVGGKVRTREETWGKALGLNGLWTVCNWGYWCVALKETDACIGQAGFGLFEREANRYVPGTPEAGWAIHPQYAGQGFATEAMAAALTWIDRLSPAIESTHCLIHPQNSASMGVADKLGYRPVTRTTAGGGLSVVLVRDREPD